MSDPTRRQNGFRWAAWGVWLLVFLVICGDVARRPMKHTTMPVYRLAATQWWSGQDPYSTARTHDAFLYLPQAALLFAPFTWGPMLVGEMLWRLATFGLFAYALVRLYDFFIARNDRTPGRTFLLLSLLAVPSAMSSLRNAQFDLPLGALVVLAAAEIADGRWNRAAAWLCLALALKPLAVVPLLLFAALYWKLIPRLAVGLLIVAALPFLNLHPSFAAQEYGRFAHSLFWASQADEPRYSDLGALLSHVAIHPPYRLMNLVRLFSAAAFLGLGALALRRLGRIDSAWTVGALSAIYVMLFNPRTETCSYVYLAPFTASLALVYAATPARRGLGFALGLASLGFACDSVPVIHPLTDRWLKPLLALLFLPVVIQYIFEPHPAAAEPRQPGFAPRPSSPNPRPA